MDKKQLFSLINSELQGGNVSREELLLFFNTGGVESDNSEPVSFGKKLTNLFYLIGGIIAVIGVITLIAQNWNDIGVVGRLLSTLGVAFACYVAGLLIRDNEHSIMSNVMFGISVILAPIGAFVLLKEMSVSFNWQSNFFTAIILSIIFGVAMYISKKSILFVSVIGFVTWAYYALLSKIFNFSDFDGDLVKWATMLLGFSYIFLAYAFKRLWADYSSIGDKERKAVQNIFYGLGTLAVLGSGIAFGGSFDFIFILILFGAFYASVFLRSGIMLVLSSGFLVGHIIKLTSRFFRDSINWSLALILIGFLVIGVGYMTVYLNRKFISKKN